MVFLRSYVKITGSYFIWIRTRKIHYIFFQSSVYYSFANEAVQSDMHNAIVVKCVTKKTQKKADR